MLPVPSPPLRPSGTEQWTDQLTDRVLRAVLHESLDKDLNYKKGATPNLRHRPSGESRNS
jgi:hypothetical protein